LNFFLILTNQSHGYGLYTDAGFAEIRHDFYPDTQGVVLVFDVSSRPSYIALDEWLKEMQDHVSLALSINFFDVDSLSEYYLCAAEPA
jgi:GTPase SAR1 family protein